MLETFLVVTKESSKRRSGRGGAHGGAKLKRAMKHREGKRAKAECGQRLARVAQRSYPAAPWVSLLLHPVRVRTRTAREACRKLSLRVREREMMYYVAS